MHHWAVILLFMVLYLLLQEHKDKHFLLERIMELSKTEKASASSVPEIPTDRTAQA